MRDLRPLASLPNLQDLELKGTPVRVLQPLAKLPALRLLTVSQSVPPAAIAALQRSLPALPVFVVDGGPFVVTREA